MKSSFCFLFLLLSLPVFPQVNDGGAGPFFRIYDSDEQKIEKGKFLSISDDFERLKILHDTDTVLIQTQSISYIRTKRSPGHLILIGGALGFAGGFTLGAMNHDPNAFLSFGLGFESMATGLVFGVGGAAAGSIATAFKKSERYSIDGRSENMRNFFLQLMKED